MIVRILVLLGTVVLLVALNRGVETTRGEERTARLAVQRLLPEEQRAELRVALIGIERGGADGSPERLLYARSKGVWRCETFYRIHAREDLIVDLLDAVAAAEAVPHSADPAHPERYGLDTERTLTLRFYGPGFKQREDRDLRYTLEVGDSIPGAAGSWVRRPGSHAVLALNTDLRSRIEWAGGTGLPPMLDPYVVPATWEREAESLHAVLVERRDGQSFELAVVYASPKERQAGADPFEWRLRYGATDVALHPFLGMGYSLFLMRTPYAGVVRPAQLASLDLDRPRAVITLTPRRGEPLVLRVGAPLEGGLVPVLNTELGLAFVVSSDVAELLVPTVDKFEKPGARNPWDAYLQAELAMPGAGGAPR